MSDNLVSKVEKSEIWDVVLASGVLGSSKNQLDLFKYLLEVKFNEAVSDIKTQQIAVDVFDRDESFSTKKDSIVRVEMHRLRANLNSFNQQSEQIKVLLPKSSYDLEIKINKPDIPEEALKPRDFLQSLRETRFYGMGAIAAVGLFAFVLMGAFPKEQKASDCSKLVPNLEIAELRDKTVPSEQSLAMYVDQVIRGAASQFSHFNIVDDVKGCDYAGIPGYRLEYSLFEKGRGFNGSLSTVSTADNKIINTTSFSGVFEIDDKSVNEELDPYFDIVRGTNDLLSPGSIVHIHASQQNWTDEELRQDYSCLTQMYQSFVSDSDKDYFSGLECLKQSYEKGTPLLDNLGGLAASYLEQVIGNRASQKDDPLLLAQVIMDKIGHRWLDSPETTLAKIMYDKVRPDYNDQQLKATLFEAEKTYTTHPTVMVEVSRYAGLMLGDWEYAVKVNERVKRLNSSQNNSIFHVDAAYALLNQSNSNAWRNCLKAYSRYSKMSNLLVNACAKKYGKTDWEDTTNDNLAQFKLKTSHERKMFLTTMRFEPELVGAILEPPENNPYD